MCSPALCRSCGKITYTGCGEHVEQVLAGVPSERRCTCAERTGPAKAAPSWPWRRRGGR